MAIKFMNLQMILWSCFHLMGNRVSCVPFHRAGSSPAAGAIKLVKSDGQIEIYHRPVTVSDIMLEFPKHMVCRSDSFYIGRKVPALAAGDRLQLGHSYFLLPNHFFQSVLSFVTIASFSAGAGDPPLLKRVSSVQAFDIQKTESGCLRLKVSEEFMARLLEEQQGKKREEEEGGELCTTPQLRKDYAQLVRGRQWKPKLETIRERNLGKLASFTKKKKKRRDISQSVESKNHSRRLEMSRL